MRYGIIATNPIERAVLATGRVPTPLIDTYAAAFGEAVLVAVERGLFDALKEGPLDAAGVAAACGTHPEATEKVLNLLTSMRYLRWADGRFSLGSMARRFLLTDAPSSARDLILMKRLELSWIDRLGDFVRSGEPLDVHGTMTQEEWGLYQRGMRTQAGLLVGSEATRRTPVPKGARDMLDIGGSHGYFSVALCRRHPGLRAVVLDLPQAVEHAAPLLAREGMGDRVVHRAGNALTDDLGESAYDLVIIWSLVHHFDDATNRELVRRAARALRPSGVLAIGEAIRSRTPAKANQLSAFFDLYFSLTSESGTWTFDEMASWQRDAGLVPRRPIKLLTAQGVGIQAATRARDHN